MAARSREKRWRDKLDERLVKAGIYKEFTKRRRQLQKQEGCDIQKAYRLTSDEMGLYSWEEFLKAEKRKAAKQKETMAKKAVARGPDAPDNGEEKAAHTEPGEAPDVNKMVPNVVVEDDGVIDILRDTKWVYLNMSRLFVRKSGEEILNEETLSEAPSNGAVGLAYYALADKQKFFERFVVKILPKESTSDEDEENEEQQRKRLDPTFEGLEEYLLEKVPMLEEPGPAEMEGQNGDTGTPESPTPERRVQDSGSQVGYEIGGESPVADGEV